MDSIWRLPAQGRRAGWAVGAGPELADKASVSCKCACKYDAATASVKSLLPSFLHAACGAQPIGARPIPGHEGVHSSLVQSCHSTVSSVPCRAEQEPEGSTAPSAGQRPGLTLEAKSCCW